MTYERTPFRMRDEESERACIYYCWNELYELLKRKAEGL